MPTAPLLRWSPSYINNASHSQSDASHMSSSSSRPPTPVVAALSEALSESILPRPLPPARLPLAFPPARVVSRPPLLTTVRPTCAIASLSATLDSPLDLTSSRAAPTRPTRTSLDALRSIHTSTSTQFTTTQSPSRWWFQTDWDSTSRERAPGVLGEGESKEDIAKNFRAPKAPLVFCHGLLGFDSVTIGPAIAPLQVSHWRGIKEVLQDNACEVLITCVPATSSPAERAKVLEKTISETYPGRAVHLIGHSMGGIDCRYLITHLTQRSFSVLSLTTIVTPHRGSTFADHFLSLAGAHLPAVLALLELLPNGGGDGKAFECLTLEAMAEFNKNTPNVDGVRYFSWGAEYEPGLFDAWKYPHSVILAKEGPNDGLVSVRSAQWGTYLGTLKDVNHLDLVGWTDGIAGGLGIPMLNLRGMRAAVRGNEVGFSPGRFYLGVADLLAGVEEEEGYVKDGVWVGSRGTATPTDKIRQQETAVAEGEPMRRTSSDMARARMEEVLRQMPSPSEAEDEEIDDPKAPQPLPPHKPAFGATTDTKPAHNSEGDNTQLSSLPRSHTRSGT
ncbi:Alpha/Beta hydrolase protein [Pisolithus marmoratus]|nr:Alpha/Beta hydrolase protein [Pisolithus marmoratus]